MDYHIGRVYQALEANGQLENTLIIFASDNGGEEGAGANNQPFRGAKQYMFEGGIHVAGGFYWKGKIQPAVNNNLILLSDIYPTLCELADINITHKIDGISVVPILQGKEQTTDDRVIHWVRREGNVYGGRAYYASRFMNYKILQNTPWEPLQFFNLADDPQEQYPIMDQSSETYQKIFNSLKEHVRQAGAIPWQSKKLEPEAY